MAGFATGTAPATFAAAAAAVRSAPSRPSLARGGAARRRGLTVVASASLRERAVAGGAAAAMAATLALPDVAGAAPGLSPSLKNFLLSIVAGGVVLAALVGAVVAVANFDPVRRG